MLLAIAFISDIPRSIPIIDVFPIKTTTNPFKWCLNILNQRKSIVYWFNEPIFWWLNPHQIPYSLVKSTNFLMVKSPPPTFFLGSISTNSSRGFRCPCRCPWSVSRRTLCRSAVRLDPKVDGEDHPRNGQWLVAIVKETMGCLLSWLVGGLEHLEHLEPWNFMIFHILGSSSSQLTNSYFSEGLKPPTR